MPCTTILVGKKASFDGSTIVARNEDSGHGEFTPKNFLVVEPSDQPRHYRSVLSHLEIDLPDDPLRYTSLPNALPDEGVWGEAGVNEANVSMSATETLTTNERVLGADPFVEWRKALGTEGEPGFVPEAAGGIGEEDLLTIVLPYIRSAREGVERLGALLAAYGTYEMNGIAFSDVNEIWWLETVGGHHWIAKRIPDDSYVTMPNQLGIDSFDLADAFGEQRDHLCSPDLREFMAENHLDLTVRDGDGDDGTVFNPRDAFGSHSERDHVYNTPRAWYMQRFLNPSQDWDGPDALYGPESDDIPWAQIPERKVTIEDVKFVLSSHYEGTPYDPYGEKGTEASRHRFRPIGVNRNGQLSVVQIRPYRPEAYRTLQWIAYGSNAFNALVPFYANVRTTPEYLRGTTARVTTENFYWVNRVIGALADAHFNDNANAIANYAERVGAVGHARIAAADAAAKAVVDGGVDASTTDAPAIIDVLEAANQGIADVLRPATEALLDTVLYTTSMRMKNAFTLSDH